MNFHFLIPLLLVLLALAFLDPFQILMPPMVVELVLGLLVLVTAGYGALIFREQVEDERDVHVRAFAHRITYFVSVAGLVAIIAYYLIGKGHVYPETILLLVLIVGTKTIAHWYGDKNF